MTHKMTQTKVVHNKKMSLGVMQISQTIALKAKIIFQMISFKERIKTGSVSKSDCSSIYESNFVLVLRS